MDEHFFLQFPPLDFGLPLNEDKLNMCFHVCDMDGILKYIP
jgi:hypothetical protein